MSETFAKHTRAHGPDDAETWTESEIAPARNGFENSSARSTVLISSMGDSPAPMSAWRENAQAWLETKAVYGLSSSGCCPSCGLPGRSLRMFPGFSAATEDVTSRSSSVAWKNSGMASPGGLWTRATSESPSAAAECSLSAILETDSAPPRYWLSAKAAQGILRRAERRGRALPIALQRALEALATSTAKPGTAPTSQ